MPNLFLVGAPKCGTTSMHAYLSWHPDVFMALKKEPHFWSTDIDRSLRMDPEEYFDLFRGAEGYSYIGEGSTEYIYSGAACEQIRKLFPKARIIIMLRNPVDKIYSGHAQRVYRGWENVTDFEEALRTESRPPESRGRTDRTLLTYRESARYSKYVRTYIETFGRERVHVMIFEEFVSDTAREFRHLCEFLEIPADFPIQFETLNARKAPRYRTLWKLLGPTSGLRRLGKALPGEIQAIPKNIIRTIAKWNTRYERPRPMAHATRQQLQEEFAGEVAELSTMLGKDLNTLWFFARNHPSGVEENSVSST
jgi:hypothetical protein